MEYMMDSIEGYVAFAHLMELGSFSAVGRRLGISQSTVSKQIVSLEQNLGVPLFVRTTRTITPTADALQIQGLVQRMLEARDEIHAAAKGENPEPVGHLRISTPISYGRRFVMPLVPKFLERYANVSLDVVLGDAPPDLMRDGFELGIFLDRPSAGSIIFRTIRVFQRVVVASPDYLARNGQPTTPMELAQHPVVSAFNTPDMRVDFDSDDGREVIALSSRIRTNSDEMAYEEALGHRAIAIVPSWLASADTLSGRMRPLLPEYVLPPIQVVLAYPQARLLSRRARSFIDFMMPELTRPASP